MAFYRCQAFYQSGITGWSETYFTTQNTSQLALNALNSLMPSRMSLSTPDVSCQYQRVSDEALFRDSNVSENVYTGTYSTGGTSDPTFVALLFRLSASDYYRRSLFLRGVPDNLIVAQLFQPGGTWVNNYRQFQAALIGSWQIRAFLRLATTPLNGLLISNTGLVTTLQNHGIAVGNTVRFRRVITTPRTTGDHLVIAVPSPTTFQLQQWKPAVTYANPFIVQQSIIQGAQITQAIWERLVSRKTGRPFDLPRGRRRVGT